MHLAGRIGVRIILRHLPGAWNSMREIPVVSARIRAVVVFSLFFSFVTLQLVPIPPPWNNYSLRLPYILIVVPSGVFLTSFSLFPSFLHWRIPASNHHHRHHGFSITTQSLVGTTAEKCHSSYSQPWPRQSQELRLSFTSEMRQQTCFWFATRFGLGVGSIGSPVFI